MGDAGLYTGDALPDAPAAPVGEYAAVPGIKLQVIMPLCHLTFASYPRLQQHVGQPIDSLGDVGDHAGLDGE